MKDRLFYLICITVLSAFGLSVPGICSNQFSACDILVPKLHGKNKGIIARTLQTKGYRVVESDLISANFTSSGPLAREISVDSDAPLPPGTLFLKITGNVARSLSTQADTSAFVYLSTTSGDKVLGTSKYKPWIGSFSSDPQLFDLGDLPNCDEKIVQEVVNSKMKATELSAVHRLGHVRHRRAEISTRTQKNLIEPAKNEGSESLTRSTSVAN